jgi:hypothetical protein
VIHALYRLFDQILMEKLLGILLVR